jgi:hypothetical protein
MCSSPPDKKLTTETIKSLFIRDSTASVAFPPRHSSLGTLVIASTLLQPFKELPPL